jgi:hypothetical protein
VKESKIITPWKVKGGYIVDKEYTFFTSIYPDKEIRHYRESTDRLLFKWRTNGWLTVYPGYFWDGASGVYDFNWIVRGSLPHDIEYQSLRLELFPRGCHKQNRKQADKSLKHRCKEDGAWPWQATAVYNVTRRVAKFASDRRNKRKKVRFPKKIFKKNS